MFVESSIPVAGIKSTHNQRIRQ